MADAKFDADWEVEDSEGNLDKVEFTLLDDTDSEQEDTASEDISGSSASGVTRLVASGDGGSGNDYTVEAEVFDTSGESETLTASATATTQISVSTVGVDF